MRKTEELELASFETMLSKSALMDLIFKAIKKSTVITP